MISNEIFRSAMSRLGQNLYAGEVTAEITKSRSVGFRGARKRKRKRRGALKRENLQERRTQFDLSLPIRQYCS